MNHALRVIFMWVVVRPILLIVLGLNIRRRELLPTSGPAVVVANHNSHLDTMLLLSLFPTRQLAQVRPVAAADYFLRNKLLAWFALNIIGIIPLDRTARQRDPLGPMVDALDRNEILILFPEGSRGEPEALSTFKSGVAHLIRKRPEVPVTPVFLHGLGKALPRGEALLIPFFCDAFVGESIQWTGDKRSFMDALNQSINALADEGDFDDWA